MRLFAQIAETVFWFALWIVIPAALLYPAVLWMLKHTRYSEYFLVQGYVIGISLLSLPTGFLVDFLYRKFVLKNGLQTETLLPTTCTITPHPIYLNERSI